MRSEQSASFPGREEPSRAVLAYDQLAGLAGRFPGLLGGDAVVDDALGLGGVLLQVHAQGLSQHRFDDALDLGVPQLGLGLALELGVGELHADDRREPLPDVLAGEVGLVVAEELLLAPVVVYDAGQGRPKSPSDGCRPPRC